MRDAVVSAGEATGGQYGEGELLVEEKATESDPVVGFAVTNAGAMFDASIEGTKVRRLSL
jgi:hypothetical protein